MGKYYSPNGNFEVWDEKPQGYYTEEEWAEMHPAPEPTKAEKLAELEAEYESEKNKLAGYYMTALLTNDEEEQADIKNDMADLEEWYNEERAKIEESD